MYVLYVQDVTRQSDPRSAQGIRCAKLVDFGSALLCEMFLELLGHCSILGGRKRARLFRVIAEKGRFARWGAGSRC